ncbi:xanthine dehydrogenase family protein molybdopterin-binding subunit [Paradesulfitobacterium aromaticivorans]
MSTELGSVASLIRRETWEKVTGEAVFAADFDLTRHLEGKVLRSPHPHARIVGIDTAQARRLPGVYAVITGNDLPKECFGNGVADQPVLARERVLFAGERVAAVAAVDEDTALEALSLIKVEYEELPVLADPLTAMREGAQVLHSGRQGYRNNRVLEKIPGLEMMNIADHVQYSIGNVEAGMAEADLILEHTFRTQVVHQGYLEPHFALVQTGRDKGVRVWTNNKAPFQLRTELTKLLGLPITDIEVIYGFIGGDFGGKGAVMDEPVCYYLCKACGQPVRIVMTTQEELLAANPRHASVITLKSGFSRDGRLLARQATVVFDSGAYAGANSHPLVGGLRRALGAYRIPNTLIDGYAVYTNSVPTGHCRAPGDPQVFFAVESHTDMLAEAVGLDSYAFRRLNVLRPGDKSPSGLKWKGINALETLDLAVTHSEWGRVTGGEEMAGGREVVFSSNSRGMSYLSREDGTAESIQSTSPNVHKYGIGMALTERSTGLGGSAAIVAIHADGSATVVSGATDPGTGSQTILRHIAAQELSLPLAKITFRGGNTGMAPYDNGSGSSRVTHVTGQAVRLAAQDALNQIRELAALQLGIALEELSYRNGTFSGPKAASVTIGQILAKAGRSKNVVIGRGSYVSEKGDSTCFSAQVAEVQVDTETGQVRVLRVIAANDIGRALNPAAVQAQVEGAVIQGMGFALNEELPRMGGRPLVQSLADYKMATALDGPAVESYLLEGASGPGPFGAKAIGEQGIAATAPAIANAIYNAVGVRIFDLPITAEKVKRALDEKRAQGIAQESERDTGLGADQVLEIGLEPGTSGLLADQKARQIEKVRQAQEKVGDDHEI